MRVDESVWQVVFWVAGSVVLYVYVGYPIVLSLLRAVIRRPVRRAPVQPTVSLLVAAYNEADVIEAKIRNTVALDYPGDKVEVVIASDGSSDGTAEIAERTVGQITTQQRVRVVSHRQNRGKLAVLNETIPQLRGEIVAFSDAACMLASDALRHLVESFADPRVGAVSGVYRVTRTDDADLGEQEDFYWRYETFLKRQEAALGSILGAHGAFYAIRKSLYPFPPAGTINDDYVIPVRIVQQGYRVTYEPRAVASEAANEMEGFSRRVRIMTGNIQQLREVRRLLRPLRPLALFVFLSHKVGRLAVPLAMVVMLVANLFLLDVPFYWVMWWLQILFYVLATLGAFRPLRPKVLRLPYYFTMINAAAFVGMFHALRGSRKVAWKRE